MISRWIISIPPRRFGAGRSNGLAHGVDLVAWLKWALAVPATCRRFVAHMLARALNAAASWHGGCANETCRQAARSAGFVQPGNPLTPPAWARQRRSPDQAIGDRGGGMAV